MTAPIYFNVQRARDYLFIFGAVYTIRHERSVGTTTARRGSFYKFDVLGKVSVRKVLRLHKEGIEAQLCDYVLASGFATVQDWMSNVKKWEEPMYLYRVDAVGK